MLNSAVLQQSLALFCIVVSPAATKRSAVVLKNNGYEGLVVAIGERVKEDQRLLDEIKAVFTSASEELFKATGRRASFRSITILVPHSWSRKVDYEPSSRETFDKANVRVDVTALESYQPPFTHQAGGCGQEGEFILLSPHFLLMNDKVQRTFGHRGKMIVHEWGHLRWGLFDEYPVTNDIHELFYPVTDGNPQGTRCSAKIQGTIKDSTGTVCNSVDPQTYVYPAGCQFYPSDNTETNGGSYMYFSSLKTVTTFCDSASATDEYSLHNPLAPNLQNKLCDGKSAWDVMRKHKDFANEANPPVPLGKDYSTNVTFKVVQRGSYAAVIVMDISGSMIANNNHVKLDAAVKNFIRFTVPDGSFIGLVYFASSARRLASNMALINNTASREKLVQLMSPTARGGTSIGAGMDAALQLLRSNNRNPTGSFMIVISDGEETDAPLISSVLPQVIAAGVIIDTLLFTQAADAKLLAMSNETGGLRYFYSGSDDYTSLLEGLTNTITNRLQQNSISRPIMITSQSISVPTRQSFVQRVIVDDDLGKETRFTFTWSDSSSSFRLSLTSPNGSRYDQTTTSLSYVQNILFNDFVQSGYWIVNITNTGIRDAKIVMQVVSKPKTDIQVAPILVQVISFPERNFLGSIEPLTVYAYVSKDYQAVTDASVWATLEGPSGTKIVKQLRDSGSGSDNVKNDGIYSAHFTGMSELGNYAVKVTVAGTNVSRVALPAGSPSSDFADFRNITKRSLASKQLTGAFERVASGELLQVTTLPQKTDKYPPSRIKDLRIAAAVYDTREVTLEFTAVGDNYDEGQAHHYILRRSDNYTTLLTNYQNATTVLNEEVTLGNLTSPAYAHETEKIVVKIDQIAYIAFCIVAVDAVGNESPPSNIVGTKLILPSSPEKDNNTLKIGLSVGGAVVILALCVVVVIATKKRRHSQFYLVQTVET